MVLLRKGTVKDRAQYLVPMENHTALRIIHQYLHEFHNLFLYGSIHVEKSVNLCVLKLLRPI